MLNVDGWTDGRTNERTNGRKLARLCLPAKAGATKKIPRTEAKICGSHLHCLLTAIDIRTKNNGPQKIFMKAVDRLHRFTDGFNFLHIS